MYPSLVCEWNTEYDLFANDGDQNSWQLQIIFQTMLSVTAWDHIMFSSTCWHCLYIPPSNKPKWLLYKYLSKVIVETRERNSLQVSKSSFDAKRSSPTKIRECILNSFRNWNTRKCGNKARKESGQRLRRNKVANGKT